ncbi:hypothetical protein C814_00837 [Anaerotruncus sp. G3(2012)]|nr:hypothetical protein C814_00837 [Anaerotruncus sp. G3(2012)]
MNWESLCDIIKKLNMQILRALLRFGTPWRTFWGYINGYSERTQVNISTEKKIRRDIKKICHFHK